MEVSELVVKQQGPALLRRPVDSVLLLLPDQAVSQRRYYQRPGPQADSLGFLHFYLLSRLLIHNGVEWVQVPASSSRVMCVLGKRSSLCEGR